MKAPGFGLVVLFLPGLVLAQPAPKAAPPTARGEPETVYSETQRQKDEQLSRRFVQSLLRPSTKLEGQFAKWKHPICPRVTGMTQAATDAVEHRIRAVAKRIGAPLDRPDSCHPNIAVYVTPQPQATLDTLAAQEIRLFGGSPRRELKMRYPVQAWYFGYFVDFWGVRSYDGDQCWLRVLLADPFCAGFGPQALDLVRTNLRPDMMAATIVVDAHAQTTLASLADYIALMALAQTPATGRCQPAPSIANLFLADCGTDLHTAGLSDADMAMLIALYQTPEDPEKAQMGRLIANMRRNLEGETRK
jgi:hypothetical protein